jgi:4-hydroxybenzoate polyprenyltransferase/predicted negative regulator of RcsB-dependent stress response
VLSKRLTSAIRAVETSSVHWSCWPATFVAFVVIRNLIESALGPSRVFGFAHSAPYSALMVLDHFMLFYASVFLSIAVVLSALSRESVGRVMRVMTPAWALVLIPPALDFLITGGRGTHISYVLSLSGVLVRFFDPRVLLDSISVGQRVEILAACLLGLAYVRLKGRSWWSAGLAFALVYLVIAVHGVLPSAFARAAQFISEGVIGLPAAAYNAAFKSGGIVLEESRKLALLYLFTTAGLGCLVFRLASPRKAAALRRNVRPLRALHYIGMTAFGVALGLAVVAPSGFALSGGGDLLGIAGLLLATFLAFEASVGLNDRFDVRADRVTEPGRPLVTGALTERDALLQFAALGAAALLAALNVKYASFLFLAMALLVSFLYSAPPVRLKRIPLLGTLSLGLLSLLSALAGFAAVAEARTLLVFPSRVGWTLVLGFGLAFAVKDLKDVDGDRVDGTLTLPVVLGPRAGRIVTAVLAAAGYLTVTVFLPYRPLGLAAAALAALNAAAVMALPPRRIVRPLLALYLCFALAAAVVVVRDVEPVLDEAAAGVTADQQALFEARTLEALGHHAEAAAAYGRLDEPELDQSSLERAGVAALRAGDAARAIPLLELAAEREPSPVATEHLLVAWDAAGDPVRATGLGRRAVATGLRPDVFLGHLAELALRAGRLEDAQQLLEASLRVGRDEVTTRVRLGDILNLVGRRDEALIQYGTASSRHPTDPAARDAYGRALHAAHRHEQAVTELEAAVALEPGNARFRNNLAVALLALQRYDDALRSLEQAAKLDARLPDAYYNRGRVYEALGRRAEARRQYLLALELDPAFGPAARALSAAAGQP